MSGLNELKKDVDIINQIDWNMTPEEAVRLYLEWGNNWAGGSYVIRSKDDVSHYFVINTWKGEPVIYLVRRDSQEAENLAEINMPLDLKERYAQEAGGIKGVFAVEGEVRDWLKKELSV
ncbi:conserved hypothetical protein [Candidatus Desulfarcum epimagneticum]|uniref:Uncharacterized protein n=1 Tax=uncultured Desulfobacteraceae bacterium TaxID=218296 RepID=A0A484HIR5_9BACT|nr:conserved hypothetical protein [uncultured Desulfobacteraceae bacterium]